MSKGCRQSLGPRSFKRSYLGATTLRAGASASTLQVIAMDRPAFSFLHGRTPVHCSSIMTTNRCLLSSLLLDIPRRGKRVPQIDGRLRDNRRQHFRSTHDRDVESNLLQSALVRFGSPSDVPTHSLEGLPGRAANGCGANNEFRKEDDADPRFFFLLIESASMRKRPGIKSYRVGRNSGWHSRESCSIAQISSCSTRPPRPSTHQPKID